MVIKKFIVGNMNEAMIKMKQELGKDAVILSQRKIRRPGFKGLFAKKVFEVTACVDNEAPKEEPSSKSFEALKRAMEFAKSNIERNEKVEESSKQFVKNENIKYKRDNFNDGEYILKEVKEMKDLVTSLATNISKNEPSEEKIKLQEFKEYLMDLDIDKSVMEKILEEIKEGEDRELKLKEILREMLNVDVPSNNGVMVLVGPTGVGKTTTIAKLAGKLSLVDKKKVGLITIDTYRIGAVEQLKTYGEIINIPFKVVMTPKEMDDALKSMSNCDVILVDTTGRSSKNIMQISELRSFIDKIEEKHVFLVISSITKSKDIEAILNGYSSLNYSSLIITKLDETSSYGSILSITNKSNKNISYITTGQSVPDDIKNPDQEELVRLILGEESVC
ncbi:flagellar biosynthesis protein FlhF [Clostridium frigidicarnis]|uniref:Flagellar biosynthesis protein FlhF n=1 Tax=Clostridium frigidicarnis TaxID=84698 RepID=A0A1I0VF92_9CLOT|nr:flagellar biosynthesis protein FlhF [Clostridium frigidicarnis]SFA74952.1 flagellar biosynthesis protein FlhF [Clostridium frigidicarnis]